MFVFGSDRPIVTLAQLKNHCPVSNPNEYSYFFLAHTEDGDEYFPEHNDDAKLPIWVKGKEHTIYVRCQALPACAKSK